MTPAELDHRLRVAEAVVREAGRLAADHFARREAAARSTARARRIWSAKRTAPARTSSSSAWPAGFPPTASSARSAGARNPEAAAVWVIDPIDGTHNFLTGIPFWCVSVGLVVAGELALGIIHHPLADELYAARSGGGAFLNGRPIKVSGETDLTRARVCVGFSYRRPVADHARAVEALLAAGCEYLRLGSGALGLAYTAAGRFDGYWERHINSWDAAAGLVLVREAGGATNDFLADEGLTRGGEVLAATSALFEPLKPLTAFGQA